MDLLLHDSGLTFNEVIFLYYSWFSIFRKCSYHLILALMPPTANFLHVHKHYSYTYNQEVDIQPTFCVLLLVFYFLFFCKTQHSDPYNTSWWSILNVMLWTVIQLSIHEVQYCVWFHKLSLTLCIKHVELHDSDNTYL